MVPQRLEPASRPPASPLGSCSCPITQGHPLPLLATSLPHPPPLLPLLTNPVKAQDDGASSSFDAPQPWPDDLRRNVCWQSRAVLCDGTRFLSLGSAGGFPYCKLLWAFWPSSKKPLSLSLTSPSPYSLLPIPPAHSPLFPNPPPLLCLPARLRSPGFPRVSSNPRP